MLKLRLLSLFAFNVANLYCQNVAPIISIPDGQLSGNVGKTELNNITYYAYLGIPFAKPPLGNLRFAAPVKNDPWTGIYNATQEGSICTQLEQGIVPPINPAWVIGSEDCLYINVYTPNINASLPVMVFIHGGGFYAGYSSYSAYSPDYLLEKDVIYVSFNYRLGSFGFLSTEDMVAPGNWGLKDQALALKWVKDNIKFFGGDPNKTTIFGQSAGSASVSYLVQSNLTRGLISGAIMESGTTLCPWSLTRKARNKAFQVGLLFGILTTSSQDLINRLRTVDYKELKRRENEVLLATIVADNIFGGLPWGPVQEPEHAGAAFTGKSWQQLTTGQFSKVPVIIGVNSNELGFVSPFSVLLAPVWAQYELDVSRLAPVDLTQNYFKRLGAGLEIRFHYFRPLVPITLQGAELTKFANVDQFYRPSRESVRLMSKFTNVYYYKFSYKNLLKDPNQPGVYHGEEQNYLFAKRNTLQNQQNKVTSQRMVELWTNFAKTGNPTPAGGTNSSLGNVTWVPNNPTTNADSSMKYLNINQMLTIEQNPDQPDWEFYQYIYSRYGAPPYDTY